MKRPWYLNQYTFIALVFGPGLIVGTTLRCLTDMEWSPLCITVLLIIISANIMGSLWHRYCAAHGHRRDL